MATRILFLSALLVACGSDKGAHTGVVSGTPSTGSLGTGTGSGTSTGTGTGTTSGTTGTGTGTGTPTGTVPLTVSFADAQCGQVPFYDPSVLTATATGPGAIQVTHLGFGQGCCPTFSATARADWSLMEVQLNYNYAYDLCDCICNLDASLQIQGIPAGLWTVTALGDSDLVTVTP